MIKEPLIKYYTGQIKNGEGTNKYTTGATILILLIILILVLKLL